MTRVLNITGYTLPDRLIEPDIGNKAGHWEPHDIVFYHDRLLADLHSSWHDFRSISLSALGPQGLRNAQIQISELIERDYSSAPNIILKDPRICRLLPIYKDILEETGYRVVPIIPFRNPAEVISSLQKRKHIWPVGYVSSQAALLWLRHVLDAEYHTRGQPRSFTNYSSLLKDWRAVVKQLSTQAGFDLPQPIGDIETLVDQFLRPDLNHNTQQHGVPTNTPSVNGWCQTAFDALKKLEINPVSKPAMDALDRVRINFNAAQATLFDLSRHSSDRITQMTQQIENLTTAFDSSKNDLVTAQQHITQNQQQIDELIQMTQSSEIQLDQAHNAAEGKDRRIEALNAIRQSLENDLERMHQKLHEQHEHSKHDLTTHENTIASLTAQLQERDTQLEQAHNALIRQQQEYTSSRSWRMTAPLRWFGQAAQRFR